MTTNLPQFTIDDQRLSDSYNRKVSALGFKQFLDQVSIETASQDLRLFREIVEPWQLTFFIPFIAPIEIASGFNHPKYQGPRKIMTFLPKGHSKTTMVALLLVWSLCFAKKFVRIIHTASDATQASILLEQMEMIRRSNSWLPQIRVVERKVHGTKGELTVQSSNAPSASGALASILTADELTFWTDAEKALMDQFLATATKRKTCCLLITSNHGVKGSWQHNLLNHALDHPREWFVDNKPGPRAGWLDHQAIAESRKILPPGLAKRLYDGLWSDLDEEADYLTRSQVEACLLKTWREQEFGERGIEFHLALDYGAVKDRATGAITHILDDVVYLDKMFIHQGSPTSRTPIDLLVEWVSFAIEKFHIQSLWVDPYQLESVAQKFEMSINVVRYAFQGAGHFKMAENLKNLVVNKRLVIYGNAAPLILPDMTTEDLVDELSTLYIQLQGNAGRYRFQHRPGRHDDRSCSLGLSCLASVSSPQRLSVHDTLNQLLESTPTSKSIHDEFERLKKMPEMQDAFGIETMIAPIYKGYSGIVELYASESYQPKPTINGKLLAAMTDYQNQHWAAFAVNAVFDLLDQDQPNDIRPLDMPSDEEQAKIVQDVVKHLQMRKMLPANFGAEEVEEESPKPKKSKKEPVTA